jgi:hypothetical protein
MPLETTRLDVTVPQSANPRAVGAGDREHCLAPTLFHEEWWLDVATSGRHRFVEVREKGVAVGRLPYFSVRRFGLTTIGLPPLTYFIGPAVDEGVGSQNTRFHRRLGITRELIAQLPTVSSHYVKCHRGVSDVIAFQMERFKTGVQFTHEFEGRSTDDIWRGMSGKMRNDIRRGEKSLRVAAMWDPAAFVRFYSENLEQKGIRGKIDFRACERLITACLERHRGRIDAAYSHTGKLEAAAFSAWDTTTSYGLMSTRHPASGNLASCLLVWEAICSAVRDGLIFDMAGISSDGSVKFFSGFGGAIRPRYTARRDTLVAELIRSLSGRIARRQPYD